MSAVRSAGPTADRAALGRRVRQFYARFNAGDWAGCFARLDPRLTAAGRVEPTAYADLLAAFAGRYGSVRPFLTRFSLHPGGAARQGDPRPFAYVYIVWKDDRHQFHLFRERWVKDGLRWYTRVVGLVPQAAGSEGR